MARYCDECGAALEAGATHQKWCTKQQSAAPVPLQVIYNEKAGGLAFSALCKFAEAMGGGAPGIEALGDFVYDIREREGQGFEGPRVKAWSEGCTLAQHAIAAAGGFDRIIPVEEWHWARVGKPGKWARSICYVCGGAAPSLGADHTRCNRSMRAAHEAGTFPGPVAY